MASELSNYFDAEEFDWDDYLRYRFTYKQGLFDRIYSYHSQKGGQWNIAHDLGTGPGNAAAMLADRFSQVVASDSSKFYTAAARQRLSRRPDGAKFTVFACRAEEASDHPETRRVGEADLVTVAECMGFLDPGEAVESFAKILKPGGTLAIWFYGRPNFVDGGARMNELYTEIATKLIQKFEPEAGTTWEWAAERICSWFDVVGFPRDKFRDVRRVKWNFDKPIYFWDEEVLWPQLETGSEVKPDEEVEIVEERELWSREGDIDWVEGFHRALQPGTAEKITPEIRELYDQLEQEMGGKGVQHKIVFPAVLILATRV